MPETTILRNKNINGYSRPQAAGPGVQMSGALPTLQVRMTGQGPQVQNAHQVYAQPQGQRPVQGYTMKPPGQRPVYGPAAGARPPVRQGHNMGALPTVVVQMTAQGPQVRSGVVDAGARPQQWSQATAPQMQQPQFEAPPEMPGVIPNMLDPDQLMLLRHLAEQFVTSPETAPEHAQLGQSAIATIDDLMNTIVNHEAMAAEMAAMPAMPEPPPPPAPPAPQPRMMYTNAPPRTVIANRSSVLIQSTAPRRIPRPMAPQAPPPVAAAPVATSAPAQAPVIDVPSADVTDNQAQ